MSSSISLQRPEIPFGFFSSEPLESSSFMVSRIGKALPYLFSETREKTVFVALKILFGFLSVFFSYHSARSIQHLCRGYSIYVSFPLLFLSISIVVGVGIKIAFFCNYLSESIQKESVFQRNRVCQLQSFFKQEPKCFSEDEINRLFRKYSKEDACELFKALMPEDVAKPIVLGVVHKERDIPFFTLYLRNKDNKNEEIQLWVYYRNPNDSQWSIIKKDSNNNVIREVGDCADVDQSTTQGDQYFNEQESKKLQEILNQTHQEWALMD